MTSEVSSPATMVDVEDQVREVWLSYADRINSTAPRTEERRQARIGYVVCLAAMLEDANRRTKVQTDEYLPDEQKALYMNWGYYEGLCRAAKRRQAEVADRLRLTWHEWEKFFHDFVEPAIDPPKAVQLDTWGDVLQAISSGTAKVMGASMAADKPRPPRRHRSSRSITRANHPTATA